MNHFQRTIAFHRSLRQSAYPVTLARAITLKEFGHDEQIRSSETARHFPENITAEVAQRRLEAYEGWRG
jgi:hypothetical protein